MNLRAVGTDPTNPTSGTIVGTTDVNESPSLLLPTLLTTQYDERSELRLFVLAPYEDGKPHAAEYIETIPTGIVLHPST